MEKEIEQKEIEIMKYVGLWQNAVNQVRHLEGLVHGLRAQIVALESK